METNSNQPASRRPARLWERTGWVIACAYGITGLILLLAAFDAARLENERLLREPDAVSGWSGQATLLAAASVYLMASVVLPLLPNPASRTCLIYWLTSVGVAYELGFGRLRSGQVSTVLTLAAGKLGVTPKTALVLWLLFSAATVILGLAMLLREWWQIKQLQDREFVANYQQFRELTSSSKK